MADSLVKEAGGQKRTKCGGRKSKAEDKRLRERINMRMSRRWKRRRCQRDEEDVDKRSVT